MSLDKQIDRAADRAGDALEQGVEKFGQHVLSPFGKSLGMGVRDIWQQKTWKTREFATVLGVTALLTGVGAASEIYYLSQIPDSSFFEWLYHKQKMTPYPVASVLPVVSMLTYVSGKGRKIQKLEYRFKLAFERVRLCSSRVIHKGDHREPEYPQLLEYLRDSDGGSLFIFQNVGLPLERWEKVKKSFEATLGEEISDIADWRNTSASLVMVKLGGAKIPKSVAYNDKFLQAADSISQVVLGMTKDGPVIHDFSKVPHLAVAGTTGAGKSVVSTSIAYQTISRLNGILFIVDFKGGVDYGIFEDINVPILFDRMRVAELFAKLREENNARIKLFKQQKDVRNIDHYNKANPDNPLRRIFVLVDELAELTDLKSCPAEEADLLQSIVGQLASAARLYRAAGIHLILTTQRPDANVMPGQIKNNIPGRLCGYFNDDIPYRIVLDYVPEPRIPNPRVWPGRFVYSLGAETHHIQTPYFQDKHVDTTVPVDYEKGHLMLSGLHEDLVSGEIKVPSITLEKLEEMVYEG